MNRNDQTCKEQVQERFNSRIKDLKTLYEAEDQKTENLGSLNDYGLSLNIVEAGTFPDQREDYIRYQLSWGGPSDEFRIYKNGDIEYWFLDWNDSASIDVKNEDANIIKNIIEPMIPEDWNI